MAQFSNYILVCGGTGCRASQSELILENLKEAVRQNGLQESVQVIRTGCFGFCEKGPVVKLIPDNTFYVEVKPEDAEDIVNEHLVKGRKVERLLYVNPETKELILDSKHINFYKNNYVLPCVTVALSILRTSTNTLPATVISPWVKP